MKGITALAVLASSTRASTLGFPFPFPFNSTTPVSFQASVDPDIIEEARLKASRFRPSIDLLDGDISNAGWTEGPPQAYMTALAKYWVEGYNWTKVQDEINSDFSHFAVNIPGTSGYKHDIPLHFVHERSDIDGAIPLILLHGWPSTHREWAKVIGLLQSQGFHIVAPDLPGFGFSPAPTYSGLDEREMGAALHQLMTLLGYDKYGVIGTDLGWPVSYSLAAQEPDSVMGYFSDFWFIYPNATDLERRALNQTTEEETLYIDSIEDFLNNHGNHFALHSQTPLGIGHVFSDSPVGFAGWIWHLNYWFNDGYEFTLDELITATLLLWIPGPFGNLRAYTETLPYISELPYLSIPTGASVWGLTNGPLPTIGHAQLTPRSWIERLVDLTFYSKHANGGHFPAQTEPELWARDVQDFFGQLVD